MKRILSITAAFVCAFFLFSSFSIRENPQDPPRGKKKQRHITLEKTDDSGKTMKLDTIVEGDGIIVWNGDTIGNDKDLEWFTEDEVKMDSVFKKMDLDFEFNIDEDDDGNVFVLKSGKTKGSPMVYEFKSDDDSAKIYKFKIITDDNNEDSDVMMWHGKNGPDHIMVPPRPAKVPRVPDIMFMDKSRSDNVIDLSDSGIISFKKKEMSGDREKITIVRKKPDDKKIEKKEKIIVSGVGDAAMFSPKAPVKAHTIKVIKKDGEDVQVIKDGEMLHLDGDEDIKVIKKDGKIIRITENKNGDEKEVEVNVEVETEKENN